MASLARAMAQAGWGSEAALAPGWTPPLGQASGPDLGALLRDLCRELGARSLAWLPSGVSQGSGDDLLQEPGAGCVVSSGRSPLPRAVDWGLVAALAPGQVHSVGQRDRLRSPRLAAGEGREFYVASAPGVWPAGVLRLLSDRTLPLGRTALVALDAQVIVISITKGGGQATGELGLIDSNSFVTRNI
ncbi:MAG: hypothetical protein V3T22_12445, partial [Planctomycetota bacterium]